MTFSLVKKGESDIQLFELEYNGQKLIVIRVTSSDNTQEENEFSYTWLSAPLESDIDVSIDPSSVIVDNYTIELLEDEYQRLKNKHLIETEGS